MRDTAVLSRIPWSIFKREKGKYQFIMTGRFQMPSISYRQMNMDYALCQALNYNTTGFGRAITFYDINCQYHNKLQERVDRSPYLSLPPGMVITPGIGLWHVHGHQDRCYNRYASNFIQGAARIDGEIMETLWAPLNIISPSARGMSTPHRKEVLDYQMNDCNFMKMIRMRKSVSLPTD